MIPGSPSPLSTSRGGHQPLRASSPAVGARRPTSVAQPTAPSEGTRSATPSSSRTRSPGASHRAGISAQATGTALASGLGSKSASQIGSKASRVSGSTAQEFIPAQGTSTGGSNNGFKTIELNASQTQDVCDRAKMLAPCMGFSESDVSNVLNKLNQHLQKNGGRFNSKEFESEIGTFRTETKMQAAEIILENYSASLMTDGQPTAGEGARSSAVLGPALSSLVHPTTPMQPKKDSSVIEAECFLEDQSVLGGGFQPGEYKVIQADSGGSGVCHTYSLDMATAPKSPDDVARHAGQKTIAICFKNGEVAHTAVKAGDRWNQLLKDNTNGKTHEFSTPKAALERLYPVVLIHQPGQRISTKAWADAIERSKTHP